MISRSDVAEEVKLLSQEERGGLRKFGVRFGAFHIFMPVLLKPAATELRLLLWALQQSGNESGLNENMLPVPANGLTSAAFEPATPEGFYRTAGFRVCNDRVVRIDMLERLADMIRDRVFWRPRFEGDTRPEGSVEGGGFSIIPDMMSLVGCSGQEFSAILSSLGYLAEQRPVPIESATATPDAPTEEAPSPQAVTPETEAENTATAQEAVAAPAAVPPTMPEATSEATPEETEPKFFDVWWPKDTGPFKRQRKPSRPQSTKNAANTRSKADKRPPRPKTARHSKPSKPKKPSRPPINPEDSPFAVLNALKAELTSKS